MHIPDLTVSCYHKGGPLDPQEWAVPLLYVGWLEYPHSFATGIVSDSALSKLKAIVTQTKAVYGLCVGFLGVKSCTLCDASGIPSPESFSLLSDVPRRQSFPLGIPGPWSQENIFVPGCRVVYAAPGGVVHYVEAHEYLPPLEFVRSVLCCPDPDSTEYYEALRASNAGAEPPLKRTDDLFKEWARQVPARGKKEP